MYVSEVIELLEKAINSDELADQEVKECRRFLDEIEVTAEYYQEYFGDNEDELIDLILDCLDYLRMINQIDNLQLENLSKLPLEISKVIETMDEELSDMEEDSDEIEEDEESDDEILKPFDEDALDR